MTVVNERRYIMKHGISPINIKYRLDYGVDSKIDCTRYEE